MKIVAVIPARGESSRFPDKPLANIAGKPMVWWVYQQSKKVKRFSDVIVATDSNKIFNVCKKYKINVLMTSSEHPSGTDRVAEVAEKIKANIYVVVMGDEPLIEPSVINAAIDAILSDKNAYAGMLATKFKNGVDVVNDTTIKLAINDKSELIYMSRCPVPYPKSRIDYEYYKNVGVYSFTCEALAFFKKTPRGRLESIEDMEMMRMLENHKLVKVKLVDTKSMSVDTPKDLERINKLVKTLKINR